MATDQLSQDEGARLAAVRRYDILDTPPDGAFDRVTALAAKIFDVPISIVSIVDEDRIWFKSHHGVDAPQINREVGLCASAILQDDVWVIKDATVDPRTLTNSLVAGELGLRFYAGVPLVTHDGYKLGTFNIIDVAPRELSDDELQMLKDLADIVLDELELRLASRRLMTTVAIRRRDGMQLHDDVVQALTAAKMAIELDEWERASESVTKALKAATKIATQQVIDPETPIEPGGLVRSTPPD